MELGFLNISKSPGYTSHDVIAILRKSLGIKKIGHFGTLDPFATGVLVIGINDATRLFEYLPSDKVYLAEITFGIETDTDDITGKVTNNSATIPTLIKIKEKLLSFTGKVKQKPPIFSAIKINGNRAYNLARKNEINLADMKEKEVEIYSTEIVSYDVEAGCGKPLLKLKIHCSSGTYIRSIARDLGKELNTYGTLSALQRIKIGNSFSLENSIELKSINKLNLQERLIPPSNILKLGKIYINDKQMIDIMHGRLIKVEAQLTTSLIQIFDNNNRLIAIGQATNDCIIKPEKVFIKNGN